MPTAPTSSSLTWPSCCATITRPVRAGRVMLPFLYNLYKSYRYGEIVTSDDPWGFGNSLEWATSSPPPRHNFTSIPRIRSERPAFEYHYPEMHDRLQAEAGHRHKSRIGGFIGAEGPRQGAADPDPASGNEA